MFIAMSLIIIAVLELTAVLIIGSGAEEVKHKHFWPLFLMITALFFYGLGMRMLQFMSDHPSP